MNKPNAQDDQERGELWPEGPPSQGTDPEGSDPSDGDLLSRMLKPHPGDASDAQEESHPIDTEATESSVNLIHNAASDLAHREQNDSAKPSDVNPINKAQDDLHPDPPCSDERDEPIIRMTDLRVSFGPLSVLNGVNIEFRRGQITVIIGPSGVGKSVLLKNIVGLIRPDSGQIYFEGRRIDQLGDRQLVGVRKQIGFLFQMGALFDSMTVSENICFPLEEHALFDPAERQRRCSEVLGLVGLTGIEQKLPANLSGGQRKRVALARAVMLQPKVMLYDEPTTGLDPIRSDLINELIIKLSHQLCITSVVVTHDMTSANRIADRMVMLYDGKIIADDEPEAFRRTENDVLQRFIQGRADQNELALIRKGFAGAQFPTSAEAQP